MFELLTILGFLFLAGALVVVLVKLLVALVLVPFKIGFWLLKGLLVLLLVVPVIILSLGAASIAAPFVLAVLALPVLFIVGGVILLAKLLA